MSETKNILEVKDLRVSYHTYAGEVQSVRGVSFELETGKALAIVGESGCGKSVTAKSIMGLIKGPAGEIKEGSTILYNGDNILNYSKKQWQAYKGGECAIIFQDALASLNPTMRVGKQIMENLMAHKNMDKKSAQKEAVEMLRMVGIPEPEKRVKQYPHEFSGGMRQRVMIAMALANKPELLIADEPTTALDVTIQAQILHLMRELKEKKNTSVIMITHDLGIVAETCDRVAVMYAGKIIEEGTLDEVFNHTLHPYTEGLFNSLPNIKNRTARLRPIHGLMPDPTDLPEGCAFAPRCNYATEACKKRRPDLVTFTGTHKAACLAYEDKDFHIERGKKNG